MRKTPCESTPRRFAHTSDFAHSSAMGGATPAAWNSALAKRWRSALGITCTSVFDGIPGSPQQLRRRRISRGRSLYERARQATIPRALTLACAGFAQWSACLTAQRTALCSRARQRSPCDPGGRNMHETKRVVLVGLIAASLAWAGAAAAQEIKLTLADQNSPTGWGPSHALQPWVKQVEDATKGRVKIEVYPSQTLIKGVDMWKGIRGGIADIGWCVQGYWPEQTPLSDVMSLPFLPISSAEKGSEALWKLYEKFPAVQKEYGEIEPLLLYTSSPNVLVSKRQVKTLDEFKGLKFRVLGGPPTEMAKALGAVPTLIPMPDVYQSLDKGVVDGAAAPWEAVQAFRLYEVAKNFTIAPFYVAYFSLCANKQKWHGFAGAKFWGRNLPDGGSDLSGALLCLSRGRVHPRHVLGRSLAFRPEARGQLCRPSHIAAVLLDHPHCHKPAGAAGVAG